MSVPISEGMEPKYYVKHNDRIPADDEVDAILRRFPELPTHYIAVLMGSKPPAPRIYNRLAQRTANAKPARVPGGWEVAGPSGGLIQFRPVSDVSKHYSYCLNETGNRDTKQRPHRILESIVKASVEIGIESHQDFEYIAWLELMLAPSMPRELLDVVIEGKNPHLIPVDDGHLLPDGPPFRIYHKPTDTHINILDEVDRDTEPVTTTKKRRNIEEKFERYRAFFERSPRTKKRGYETHYGFGQCLVRFLTTSEANKQTMMRLYETKYGPSAHTLFATVKDWFYERSYPPADGAMFTCAYQRVGFPDYYLNRFYAMDR